MRKWLKNKAAGIFGGAVFRRSFSTIYTSVERVFASRSDSVDYPLAQSAALTKVVRAITRNVAQVPFQVGRWRKEKDAPRLASFHSSKFWRGFMVMRPDQMQRRSNEVWEPDTTSKFANLFFNPNPLMSLTHLVEAIEMHLLIDGEAFVHLIRKDLGIPDGMEVLSPSSMQSVPSQGIPTGWLFNGTKEIPCDNVIHIKYYNPYDPVRGLSPRAACELAIQNIWDGERFNSALLRNGGFPGSVLLTKNNRMTKKQRDAWREEFDERHRGAKKTGRPMLLSGDVEWKPVEYNHKEMQFLELLNYSEEQIRGVYKVPEAEISKYENTSYASANVGRKSFWEATILPDLRLIEDAFWLGLFSKVEGGRYEGRFDLSEVPALRESLTPKLEQAKILHAIGYPINAINARLNLGMEDVAWGDERPVAPPKITEAKTVAAKALAGKLGRYLMELRSACLKVRGIPPAWDGKLLAAVGSCFATKHAATMFATAFNDALRKQLEGPAEEPVREIFNSARSRVEEIVQGEVRYLKEG